LFSHRIGFSFFRRRVPSLEANALWFKNIFGLTLASRVIAELDHTAYAAKYKAAQRAIVDSLAEQTGLPLKASDAFLLANVSEDARLTAQQREVLRPYQRGNRYRLCLTPYFFELNEAAASTARSLNF
jgi:predicted nucleic acid-binding protein